MAEHNKYIGELARYEEEMRAHPTVLQLERRDIVPQVDKFGKNIKQFVHEAWAKWIEISELLSKLPKDDFNKLKDLGVNPVYLKSYKLLTLDHGKPKSGDIFVDLSMGKFSRSPCDPKEFKWWKRNSPRRGGRLVGDFSVGNLFLDNINRDLSLLDPNLYACKIRAILEDSK